MTHQIYDIDFFSLLTSLRKKIIRMSETEEKGKKNKTEKASVGKMAKAMMIRDEMEGKEQNHRLFYSNCRKQNVRLCPIAIIIYAKAHI